MSHPQSAIRNSLILVLAVWGAANASAQVLNDPWVRTDRCVDCRSRETILADIIKPGQTDEQKAVAIWRFMMDHTWHFSRADAGHPMDVLRVYGYSLCGTLSEVQNYLRAGAFPASYIAGGGCSRYGGTRAERYAICKGWLIDSWMRLDGGQDRPGSGSLGHSMGEVFYDGHWHFLDCHGGFFVYTADGGRIAGYDDLQSDPTLVSDPIKTSDPFMPYDRGQPLFYYRFSGGGGSGTPDPAARPKSDRPARAEPSMAVTLRPGEKYIRQWQGSEGSEGSSPGNFKWSASWKGEWNKEYIADGPRSVPLGPNTYRRYANARFVYELPVGKPGAARAGLASAVNLAFAADSPAAKSPAMHPADPAKPMSFAIDVHSPYVLIRGKLTGRIVVAQGGQQGGSASAAIECGKKQTVIWQSDKPGPIHLNVAFDKELGYGNDYRLLVAVSGSGGTGGGVETLTLETVAQLNPLALPRLLPGKNTVTVTSARPEELSSAGPLLVTYSWQEKSGLKAHTQQVTASPQSYAVEVGEVSAADSVDPSYMRQLQLELPAK